MRELSRGDQGEVSQPSIAKRNYAASLHRKHAMAGSPNGLADLDCRCPGNILDRSILGKLNKNVVAPLFMHEWRIGPSGCDHVSNRRQFLELDRDGIRNILRLRAARSDALRNHFTDVAHLSCR